MRYSCIYCPRDFSNPGGLATHQPYCKLNPTRIQKINSPLAHAKKGTPAWNKGQRGDPRYAKSEETKAKLRISSTGKARTPELELERRRKITEKAKLNNGGYRQGSGRGKKGWYKGIFCDSSWELAYVIWCLEHNKQIERNTQKFEYFYDNKRRNYIPDFIVDGKIIEVKGYKTEQWIQKVSQCPIEIEVMYKEELTPILEYVIITYGRNFISLYGSVTERPKVAALKADDSKGSVGSNPTASAIANKEQYVK